MVPRCCWKGQCALHVDDEAICYVSMVYISFDAAQSSALMSPRNTVPTTVSRLSSHTKGVQFSWCFKPTQPQRITSGLRETFIRRYIVERTNTAEIRPAEQSEKAESCRENLWNEI